VASSRDELTGGPESSRDFLPAAQREDAVSGVGAARCLRAARLDEAVADQLTKILRKLEGHYEDRQDTEFTGEDGRLFMLHTESAKRLTGSGALCGRCLRGTAVNERKTEAIVTIDAGSLYALLRPAFDATARYTLSARSVAAAGRRKGRHRLHGAGGSGASGGREAL